MDKLKALYESYIEQGLLSKETSFEQFSQSDSSIQEVLYNQGIEEKIISPKTTLDVFTSAWAEKKIQLLPIQMVKRKLRNPLQMWKQIRPLWTLLQQQQALMYL